MQMEIFLGNFILCFLLYEKQEKQDEPYIIAKNWSFSCGNSLQQN